MTNEEWDKLKEVARAEGCLVDEGELLALLLERNGKKLPRSEPRQGQPWDGPASAYESRRSVDCANCNPLWGSTVGCPKCQPNLNFDETRKP